MIGVMMRRIVSLLLIPLMFVSQSFGFAHTHQGTGTAEPEGHSARPHFHVHGAGNHHHHQHDADHSHHHVAADRDAASLTGFLPLDDHDDDAVYVSTEMLIHVGRQGSVNDSVERLMLSVSLLAVTSAADHTACAGHLCDLPPPRLCAARCPIYLRNLSLRI